MRGPAVKLAQTAIPAADESPGLSLGVFAAIPPVEAPVPCLLHLVVGKSGAVSGYQYDFATNTMQSLRGALDQASQRMAWQVGNDVMEAGVANLTGDLARASHSARTAGRNLWILMRISGPTAAEPAAAEPTASNE